MFWLNLHSMYNTSPSAYRKLQEGLSLGTASVKSSGLPSESHLRKQKDNDSATDGSDFAPLIASLQTAAAERQATGHDIKFVSISLDDVSTQKSVDAKNGINVGYAAGAPTWAIGEGGTQAELQPTSQVVPIRELHLCAQARTMGIARRKRSHVTGRRQAPRLPWRTSRQHGLLTSAA